MRAGRRLAGAALALWLGGLACGDAAGPESAIEDFRGGPEEIAASFARLEEAIATEPEEVRAAALAHLDADDPDVRYAALYALAASGDSAEARAALLPFLESRDVNERLLSAEALLARGERAAFPVLIAALGSDDSLGFREPPERAWEVASHALLQATEEDLGLVGAEDAAASAAARAAWQQWWERQGDRLSWDEAAGIFRKGGP